MRCPLCDGGRSEPSWLGAVLHENVRYEYRICHGCGSSYCDPMPGTAVLERMYGPAYADVGDADPGIVDPKQPQRVLEWLARHEVGTFVDFGCGSGQLLRGARDLGWQPLGVEFDEGVVEQVARDTECRVVRGLAGLEASPLVPVDVVHLGDVIEHLPQPAVVLRSLLSLLKPEGVLLAQGPLEAGPCLFVSAMRLARWARPRPARVMPPFHVLQATVAGQQALFRRLGLETMAYSVSEVSWPAPDRLTTQDLRRPRTLGLYAARKASQGVSAVSRGTLGNRYFYAGRCAAR